MKTMSKKSVLFLAGIALSFSCTAGPKLISVEPDRPGTILVTVDWGKMVFDPQRGEFRLPCAGDNCMKEDIGLIANINGRDEDFPPLLTKLQSAVTTEADALRLLTAASKLTGVSRFRVPLPVTSDLCFKYTLGSAFEAYSFHEPACIAKSLLKLGKIQS